VSDGTPQPTAPEPASAPARPRRHGIRRLGRWTRRLLALVAAVIAASFLLTFSIDLGRISYIRTRAEREASNYLERPMHIGKLKALLTPGEFALEDVVIEGLTPDARPFLKARRIDVRVPWWTLFRNQLHVEVRMTGWEMTIEAWAGGRHNLPKLMPKNRSTGPRRFTTTVDFVYAEEGQFTYDDHGTPWGVIARNLSFELVRAENLQEYVGTARFSGGTVTIQDFVPMQAAMTTRFVLDGSKVNLQHIDLVTDGAVSHVSGVVDFGHWPEQTYNVNSVVDFSRMREIFFANESWRLSGEGHFAGVFHLYSDGRELTGEFSSEEAGVNQFRFPDLHGTLTWTPTRFVVTHADSDFAGGQMRLSYGLAPLGVPNGRPTATFSAEYSGVDLEQFGGLFDSMRPLNMRGTMRGHVDMTWPNGQFGPAMTGGGETFLTPPDGAFVAPATLPASTVAAPPDPGEFQPRKPMAPLPVAGEIRYGFSPDWLTFDDSWTSMAGTYVRFGGRTAWGERSEMPFHVTSTDWQQSDRLLAAIMTAFDSPSGAVEVGGYGVFDGALTGSFRAPRVAGRFAGEAMRAWGVTWGRGTGDLVIENGYLDLTNGLMGEPTDASIRADGRFALGYPRKDGGEELNARIRVTDWPLDDFRTAFRLDDWPVTGVVGEADLQLYGPYEGPFGSGRLRIDRGSAWHETFETAGGDLRFEGTGLRLDRLELTKAPGAVTGAAWIGWDGTYSFTAQGDHVAVETLDNFKVERAPLSGVLRFTASGAGAFDDPDYEFDGRVADLFAGDEGIGQVSGHLTVRNNVLTFESLNAASNRLQVTGSGSIALNDLSDAEMRFRFLSTSIDPYLKFVAPEMSPYTRAIVSGSVRVAGPLGDVAHLLVDTTIDDATLTLFDYELHNDGPVRLTFEDDVFRIGRLRLSGDQTDLELGGEVDAGRSAVDVQASGQANLAILQLFFGDLSASGAATLRGSITGPVSEPMLSGEATITGGSIRHFSLPHSLNNINGRITFDGAGIDVGGLTAKMGNGDVTFGGMITLRGYRPEEFNLTAHGSQMRLRYPEGFQSTVDADLALTGPIAAPRLTGSVLVLRTQYFGRLQGDSSLLDLATAGGVSSPSTGAALAPAAEASFPMSFDVSIHADRMPFIDTRTARIEGSGDLRFFGTIDRPILTGRVDIEGGEVLILGNRYQVRRGSVDFVNPTRIEPVFDIEAETRARTAGQTFTVTIRITGTTEKLVPTITSDPWLPDLEVVSLLLGETPDVGSAEQRQLRSPQEAQTQLLRTAAAQLLASPLTSRVGSVFEKTLPLDTVQITPQLGNESKLQQLNPTARLTLGTRISSRVFLTYIRTLSASQYEIILIEYDQSDNVSWVLSRNEDRTFALDFRIRHIF
jgi:TamB, inner membrane protein subunit of TAM complex